MRFRGLVVVPFAAAAFGCGDGVGHPIVEPVQRQTVTGGATGAGGNGGTSTSTGGALAAGAPTGGAELGGATFVPGEGKGGGDFGPPRTGDGGGWDGRGPREPLEEGMVPSSSVCAPVADWDVVADAEEQDFVRLLNFTRESGFACGSGEPLLAGPLEVSPELRCAARLHSKDMSERGFFDHVNPDGDGPEARMRRAGASFRIASETIAAVEEPGGQVGGDRWELLSRLLMARGEDCRNVADPGFDQVGVGLYDGLLTLEFTGP